MHQTPTTPGQSSHPKFFSGPTSDLVCTRSKISPRRDLGNRRYKLYPKNTSAKNPHHSRQLSLSFDLSCMGPKSSQIIPSDEYLSQDLVHGIGEKPSSVTVLVRRTLRNKGLMRWLVRLSAVTCATWFSPVRSVTKINVLPVLASV